MEIPPPLPLNNYLSQEFQAMDFDNRGYLNTHQFQHLLLFLGYDQKPSVIQMKVKQMDPDNNGIIRETDYTNVMNKDKEFLEGTKFLREMFKKFDRDDNGYAYKTDVIQDLKDMGFYSPEMESRIDAMDPDLDGQITYKDFLRIYFRGKNDP